jgi:hypothetical protein
MKSFLIQPHIQQPADAIRYADDTDKDGILIFRCG